MSMTGGQASLALGFSLQGTNCPNTVHTPSLVALSGLYTMTLPVHVKDRVVSTAQLNPALELPNISSGVKAEAKQSFWVSV